MSASALRSPSPFRLGTNRLRGIAPEWHKLFQAPVEEDDPIWKEYIEEATAFDNRMIGDWNKAIDVVLVYDVLLTGILTAFIIPTIQQSQPNPANISNQLLVAIYQNQLAALQNTSPIIIDTSAIFQRDLVGHQPELTVFYKAMLFMDLAVAIIVSLIALFAKIWIINYSNRVNSSGTPYERAMRRQEAYNGVLVWKMGAIIDSLPFLLLIAISMFGLYIFQAVVELRDLNIIGNIIGVIFVIEFIFLLLLSIAAAFIPACPFYSSLSTLIQLLFKSFPDYSPPERIVGATISRMKPGLVWISIATLVSVGATVTAIFCFTYSGFFFAMVCFPFAAAFSLSGNPPRSDQRPPKYGIHHWFLFAWATTTPVMLIAVYFLYKQRNIFIGVYSVGSSIALLLAILMKRMNKFTPDTLEIDAVAWLLKWTLLQDPPYFRKVGQISREPVGKPAENYEHRKALLLNSLLPLLSPLITSKIRYHTSSSEGNKTEDLSIYVACLAQLSAFTDFEESFWKNQAAMKHPSPPNAESLSTILKTLENHPNLILSGAAKDALKYYRVEERQKEKDFPNLII